MIKDDCKFIWILVLKDKHISKKIIYISVHINIFLLKYMYQIIGISVNTAHVGVTLCSRIIEGHLALIFKRQIYTLTQI